ncbi:hypothetical protein NC653_013365 [Populus alba x Populus x berolinensis]|uniref:Uncharacterized protein n=1 Tax=Populus alba x Populus x berolinensis TaxID=444605 RepID=A0AAD6QU89_9ROSI|nr:hypothetical protein NC653_013365 [Populus alba x Populus x berolinensis]
MVLQLFDNQVVVAILYPLMMLLLIHGYDLMGYVDGNKPCAPQTTVEGGAVISDPS